MRDKLFDEKHWESMIRFTREEIEEAKEVTAEVIVAKGEDFYGVRRGFIRQRSLNMSLLNCLYSSGAPIDEIKSLLPDILETFTKSWTNKSGYLDIIKI